MARGRGSLAIASVAALVVVSCSGGIPTPTPAGSSPSPTTTPTHAGTLPPGHSSPVPVHTFGHPEPSGHASPHPHASAPPAPAAAIEVRIDASQQFQTFDGFGGTLTIFEQAGIYNAHDPTQPPVTTATDDQRKGIADLLYGQLGLTRLRVVLNGFEPSPGTFDWTGSATDAKMSFVDLARPAGLNTVFWQFAVDGGSGQAWLSKPGSNCALDPTKIDQEVEWLLAGLLHARDRGLPVDWTGINNEPDLCPPGSKIEIADFTTIVKQLGARLRAEGLQTKIVVSDGWLPQHSIQYMRAALADPDAAQYVGALAYHSYDAYGNADQILQTSALGLQPADAEQIRRELRDLATQYSLPLWMTEVCYCTPQSAGPWDSLRARLNHVNDELAIANVNAFDVMNEFFIERPGIGDELVHVYFRPDGALDRFEISPYGQLIGQYQATAPPGSVRINTTAHDAGVRALAFTRPDGKLGLAILSNYSTPVHVTLYLSGVEAAGGTLTLSSDGALGQTGPDVLFTNGSATIEVPALGLLTLIGR